MRALPLGLTSLILCAASVTAQMNIGWVRTFNSAAAELAAAMVVSPNGTVTVAGNSNSNVTLTGVVSYDSVGSLRWSHMYGVAGGPEVSQFLRTMVGDAAGNIYVTGTSSDPTSLRVATVVYGPNGELKWEATDSSENLTSPEAIAVAPDGSTYVVGEMSLAKTAADDWMIVKYDTTGDTAWTRTFTSLDDKPDRAYAVVLDSAANVYVTGFITGGNGPEDWNVAVRKYSPEGAVVWSREWVGADSTKEIPVSMLYDTSGYIYVIGLRAVGSTSIRNLILKYDLDGTLQWEKEFGDYSQFNYTPESGALASTGELYFFGRRSPAGSITYIYKVSADGESLWTRESRMLGYSMLVGSDDAVYLVGQGTAASTGAGAAMQKWSANGDSLWAIRYVDPNGGYTAARVAGMDGSGNVYVSGSLQDTVTFDADFLTIKYELVPTDVADGGTSSLPSHCRLGQNYPNPFNPETQIEFTLPRADRVRLEVLNLLGQRVKTIVDERLPAGLHRYVWAGQDETNRKAASGMYFYRLQASGFVSSKKMVLLR